MPKRKCPYQRLRNRRGFCPLLKTMIGGKMITLRVIAVGLGLSAFFMVQFFDKYLTYAGTMNAWGIVIGLTEIDPIFQTAGAQMFFFTSYMFVCLVIGMFIASFYPKAEIFIVEVIEKIGLILKNRRIADKLPIK